MESKYLADKIEMKEYETEDYALLEIICLILNIKPRILLCKNNHTMEKSSGGVKTLQVPIHMELPMAV